MFIVSIILILALLVFIFVVKFVLTNLAMFQTPFDIVVELPILKWTHTWEGVEFMYIIAGSVLLGALVIALSTWVLDTKRKLKLRSMRKELNRLQEALEHARSSLPEEKQPPEDAELSAEGETSAFSGSSSATPEEIRKSFKNSVKDDDFLHKSGEFDEDLRSTYEPGEEQGISDQEKQLLEEAPIEAELVDTEDVVENEKPNKKRLESE